MDCFVRVACVESVHDILIGNETMHRLKKVLRYHSDPGVLVVLAVLVSAVGGGIGSGDGVGRWRGGGAGRQAMAEVWSLL